MPDTRETLSSRVQTVWDIVENENHNMTHEARFFHDADEWNDNFQKILTALPSKLKSNIDGASKNKPESKSECVEMLQEAQKLLGQHCQQLAQKLTA